VVGQASLSDGRITYRYLKVYRQRRALPSPSRTPPPLIFTPPNSKRGTLSDIYYVMCNAIYIYIHIYVRVPLTPAIWASSAEPLRSPFSTTSSSPLIHSPLLLSRLPPPPTPLPLSPTSPPPTAVELLPRLLATSLYIIYIIYIYTHTHSHTNTHTNKWFQLIFRSSLTLCLSS